MSISKDFESRKKWYEVWSSNILVGARAIQMNNNVLKENDTWIKKGIIISRCNGGGTLSGHD